MTWRYVDEGWRILEKVEREKAKRLKRGGAITRSAQRKSIRFRKKQRSKEGDPPFSHTRGFGIKTIFFAWDPSTQTVVIGPVMGEERTGAVEALEFGGWSAVPVNKQTRRRLGKKRVRRRIGKRPSGFQALKASVDKYPAVFRGIV